MTEPYMEVVQPELKLRHEFVGMMFAVTIGEVGLQTASLVQLGHFVHYLPAYFHLLLATVTIAASWVGWSLSVAPGARQDVRSVFQPEFLILLLDVALVICYFILVRYVELVSEGGRARTASAAPEAWWILGIFGLYFLWDLLTKVVVPFNKISIKDWATTLGFRMLPTVLCALIGWTVAEHIQNADPAHVIPADLALISLVLLFRAMKDLVSAISSTKNADRRKRIIRAIRWTLICGLAIAAFTWWTVAWPMPKYVNERIARDISEVQ